MSRLNDTFASASGLFGVNLLQSLLEFGRKLFETSFATRLQIHVVELGLLGHFRVTERTGKVVNAPRLVECRKDISRDDLIAHKAQIAEQLVVMRLAIRQALLFVMPMSKERLLALCTHKVLHVPVLAQCSDHTLFDWSVTGAADRNTHLVVAAQTV